MRFCRFFWEEIVDGVYLSNGYLRRGLRGNQPFCTRFCCSNISSMLQNEENAVTPSNAEANRLPTHTDNAIHANPNSRNHHQHRVPK